MYLVWIGRGARPGTTVFTRKVRALISLAVLRQRYRQEGRAGVDEHQRAEVHVKGLQHGGAQPVAPPHEQVPHRHQYGKAERFAKDVSLLICQRRSETWAFCGKWRASISWGC